LEKIFDLFNLLAARGNKLFTHPAIVEDPEKALKSPNIIDELSYHERMDNFARNMLEFIRIQAHKCNILPKFCFYLREKIRQERK